MRSEGVRARRWPSWRFFTLTLCLCLLPLQAHSLVDSSTTDSTQDMTAVATLSDVTPLGPMHKVELAPLDAATYRTLDRVVLPMDTSDGAGVSLRRSIGGPKIQNLDPFLLLDEFKSDDVRKTHVEAKHTGPKFSCRVWPSVPVICSPLGTKIKPFP